MLHCLFASLLKSSICLSIFILQLFPSLFVLCRYSLPAQMSYVEKYDNFEIRFLCIYNVNRCFGNMEICPNSTQQTSAAFSHKHPRQQKCHEANGFGAAISHPGGSLVGNCCGRLTQVQGNPFGNQASHANIISYSSHCLKPLYHDCYKSVCPLKSIQSLTQGGLTHLHEASLC